KPWTSARARRPNASPRRPECRCRGCARSCRNSSCRDWWSVATPGGADRARPAGEFQPGDPEWVMRERRRRWRTPADCSLIIVAWRCVTAHVRYRSVSGMSSSTTRGGRGRRPADRRTDLRRLRAALPSGTATVVDQYERHLTSERGLSAHTVRAYVGDVVSLLAFVHGTGATGQDASEPGVDTAGVDAGGVDTAGAGTGGVDIAGADAADGGPALAGLDLEALRAWLGSQRNDGRSRTTLARRAASARTFTAWAADRGLLAVDPGLRLAAPKAHRTLPGTLRPEQAGE